jgi:hypothetical protein
MNQRRSSWLLAPVHAAALCSAAKSFRDNPILGSRALNRAGLHISRVRLAAALGDCPPAPARALAERERFGRFSPRRICAQARLPTSIILPRRVRLGDRTSGAGARDDPRRCSDAADCAQNPYLGATAGGPRLVEDPYWLALIRYAGSSALTPLTYVQTIFSRVRPGAIDPQTLLHADTFH